MMNKIHTFFNALSDYLTHEITPIAHRLDSDRDLLKTAYQQLIELGNLHLLVPKDCGGFGGERRERIDYNILMAEHSGVLLFLQTQHLYAISRLKKLLPNEKVFAMLKNSLSGQGMGVGFAANKNILRVKSTDNGFLISGQLRWITGFDYFSRILFSFDVNNEIFYALLPFKPVALLDQAIIVTPPIETVVFSAANTVSLELRNWFIAVDDIIATQPLVEKQPFEHPAIYNFTGAAKALLDIAARGKYADHPKIKDTLFKLQESYQQYHVRILQGEPCSLSLRAEGLMLAEKCAKFARIVCGSDSLLSTHPLSRISREIWQYMIAGYNIEQLEAYLATEAIQASFSLAYSN